MNREEFIRTTPEDVGIRSESVLRYLDRMDDGHAQVHSLMIMRHGKIAAEGWWSPYAPGLRHTMMSTSKTFTGTAIGLAIDEGILSLDDRIVDIFSDEVPEDASEYLKEITIYHLLTMSCGMEEACVIDENYVSNFMHTPVLHKPGTDFFYNDSAVTLLPLILYKKTGLSMIEFLKPRLFDKIGIDSTNITWFNVATNTAFGAGGLHCTTEDAMRLMKLYAQGGKWNGEQVLSKEYVQQATRKQIDTNTNTPRTKGLPKDNQYGYGFLMWMGSKEGTYRSEGAFGQITLVVPQKDLIISFTEANYSKDPASQESMDRTWEFVDEVNDEKLPENKLSKQVAKRFASLSLEKPPYQPYGTLQNENITYSSNEGIHIENLFYNQVKSNPIAKTITGLTSFSFHQKEPRLIEMKAVINNKPETISIPLDGTSIMHNIDEYFVSQVYVSGYWKEKDALAIRFNWIETVFEKEIVFHFNEDECVVSEELLNNVRFEDKPIEIVFKRK